MTLEELKASRHKTAISRKKMSRPMRLALSTRFVNPNMSLLDYGCGKGEDVRQLKSMGIKASGYDSQFNAGYRTQADIVTLFYVLNVIEDPVERNDVLRDAYALANNVLFIAVRTGKSPLKNAEPHSDGWITSKGTFQKFFTTDELLDYVYDVLGIHAARLIDGIVYIKGER